MEKRFPLLHVSDINEINESVATLNFTNFRECIVQEFKVRPLPEHLI